MAKACKYTVVIIRPKDYLHSDCFKEVATAVTFGIRRMGHECEMAENAFRIGSQHIIFGGHLLGDVKLPENSILYNLEQVGGGNIGVMPSLAKRSQVWDYSLKNVEDWKAIGIEAAHVPFCYVPELTKLNGSCDDTTDVLFYGCLNERRQKIVNALKSRGVNVETKFGCYGDDLLAAMNKAKIILNVHFYDSKIFEVVRVGYALANKKAVVSETSADDSDYSHLRDGIKTVEYESVVDACVKLLKNESERKEIANKGFHAYSAMTEMVALQNVGIKNLIR